MKKLFFILAISSILLGCNQGGSGYKYPQTKKVDTTDTYFGVKVADSYRWLENDTTAETKQWVKEQNEVTFGYLKAIPFRQKLIDRLTQIFNYERFTVPYKEGGKYFYSKNNGLQNQNVMYVQNDVTEEGKVLLDPNTLSSDGTVALAGTAVSKDGKYLAYSIARGGSDWNEIFVRDITTGKDLSDHITWVKFSGMAWYKDGFFYSRFDEPKKGEELTKKNEFQKVYYHKIGTDPKTDVMIYEDKAHPSRMFGAGVTDDEKYLIISESESTSGNSLLIKDLSKKDSKFVLIAEGFDFDYNILDHIDGKLYILTNYNAPRYKLISVDVAKPAKENWKDIIPEKQEVLSWCQTGEQKLIAHYMKDAHSKVELYDFTGKFLNEIELPALGTLGGFSARRGETTAFYSFVSFTIPSTIYKFDFATNKSEVFRKPAINFDFSQYETKQVFYTSKDGTKIPMFITHKKDIKLDGTNPTLLYGYGGFNTSLTPNFSISNLIWFENGGVYAVANLRGGGEYGEEWHKAGTILNKQNVFDDFIAAAEYLIKEKYTTPEKLAIRGGSNGGLLIGAVTNQRPELFKVALPAVGVMDMLRYHKFTIGYAWATDYGLSTDSVQFNYLYKYSPLHNIKEGVEYPAILVTTADHDDRVVPAHSFKYAATLQEKYKGKNPVMIRIDTQAGHGAGKPTAKVIEESADIFGFIFTNMGITPKY